MARRIFNFSLMIILAFCLLPGCVENGEDETQTAQSKSFVYTQPGNTNLLPGRAPSAEPSPSAGALLPSGPDGAGGIILPSGRRISPASNMDSVSGLEIHGIPSNVVVSPDGNYIFANSIQDRAVSVISTATWTVIDEVSTGTFYGMAVNTAGDRLYVSAGGDQVIREYEIDGSTLTLLREIEVFGFPIGVTLSADNQTLYATSSYGNRMAIIDLVTGLEVKSGVCRIYPFAIALNSDNSRAYVTNWGSESVSVINTANGNNIANIPVGKNPEGIALSSDGTKLFVANSDTDTVSVIAVSTNEVTNTIDMLDDSWGIGASPTSVLIHDGKVYVTCAGNNSIAVIDEATEQLKGHIPTGWYPLAVAVHPTNPEMYVVNAKGEGKFNTSRGISQSGTANKFDLDFNQTALDAYTQLVEENNSRPTTFYADQTFTSPIPTEIGTPSEQIKHVIFVMKENKTYDMILGDLPTGNGDPAHLVFGLGITPNAHALATAFTNCDNLYGEAETSLQGHMWSTATICNDYVEKSWTADGREAMSGVEPAAIPENDFIFKHMLDHGVEFRSYGQVVGTITNMETLAPYVSLKYGFWNMGVSDEKKIDEVIRDIEADIFPPFVYISLPNDHTNGNSAGVPTQQWYVADNDAALGKLVDYISHSEHWADTAIFVTQDDPQSGTDHVDNHRTLGLVISPWAKRGYTSSVHYSMNSIIATMEMILGVPPLTNFDQQSAPMYDCFTMVPDNTPYTTIPNPIPFETNPVDLPLQEYCENENWDAPDQVERLGEVVWSVMRPGEKFPFQYSVDPEFVENPEEEAEEAVEYRNMVKAWTEFGLSRGISPLKAHLPRHP